MKDLIKSGLRKVGLEDRARQARRALTGQGALSPSELRAAGDAMFKDYAGAHPVRKLHLGCGFNLLAGWLNSDLTGDGQKTFPLDATQPFPFPDNTFDFVYSEHMIEHIPFLQGAHMLAECRRVLRPGGKLRISTPDLAFVVALYQPEKTPLQKEYLQWSTQNFIPDAEKPEDTFVINNFVRAWGHQFIYDEKTLRRALEKAGFARTARCRLQESGDEALRGLENDTRMPAGFLELESLVMEAVKG